MLRRGQ